MEHMVKIQSPDRIIVEGIKKKDRRIFLDLDGVVVDWLGGSCKVTGLDIEEKDARKKLKNNDRIYNILGITEKEMWKKIDATENWWEDLEILPWGKKLYKVLSEVGHVCFLTSPSESSNSFSGKSKWIKNYFPKAKFLIGEAKEFCAAPNSILVDDSGHKIDTFREWKGNAFLWPNQYRIMDNEIDIDDTIKELLEQISKI